MPMEPDHKPAENQPEAERPPEGSVSVPEGREGPVEREVGGRVGPDPVRYGDWEKHGRCIDF